MDSVQIYKKFDIGSAKPNKKTLELHKHHLVDEVDPKNIFSVKDFYNQTHKHVLRAHSENRVPLLVGGTMMYFNALFKGINDLPTGNEIIRNELQKELALNGLKKLFDDLRKVDPESAKTIKPTDKQRIIRALEVFKASNKKLSDFKKEKIVNVFEDYNFINIGIFPEDRKNLQKKIRKRVQEMISLGLIEEVKRIIDLKNIPKNHPALNSINYKEAIKVINGELDFTEFENQCLISTRQLVKRQLTWMRNFTFSITFDTDAVSEVEKYLEEQIFLK